VRDVISCWFSKISLFKIDEALGLNASSIDGRARRQAQHRFCLSLSGRAASIDVCSEWRTPNFGFLCLAQLIIAWVRMRRSLGAARSLANWAPVLVLGNGAAGAEKQAIALADALGLPYQVERRVPSRAAMRLPLPTQLAVQSLLGPHALGLGEPPQPPFPLLAISCGRASVPASVAVREASGRATATVHVQRPLCDASRFDMVVAPRHDFAGGERSAPPNALLTAGALGGVPAEARARAREEWAATASALPRPRVALLVGGPVTRRWWQRRLAPPLDAAAAAALLRSAGAAAAREGGSLLVSPSRRTPPEVAGGGVGREAAPAAVPRRARPTAHPRRAPLSSRRLLRRARGGAATGGGCACGCGAGRSRTGPTRTPACWRGPTTWS